MGSTLAGPAPRRDGHRGPDLFLARLRGAWGAERCEAASVAACHWRRTGGFRGVGSFRRRLGRARSHRGIRSDRCRWRDSPRSRRLAPRRVGPRRTRHGGAVLEVIPPAVAGCPGFHRRRSAARKSPRLRPHCGAVRVGAYAVVCGADRGSSVQLAVHPHQEPVGADCLARDHQRRTGDLDPDYRKLASMVRRRWLREFGAAIIVAGVLAPVTDAVALWDDKLELFVAETVTRDDNVFRISSGLDPAALGLSSKGDTSSTTSFGFNLDVPVSRQRFQGGVTWNKTRYDRFTVLNLDGHQGRGTWLWQLGNDISGQLGYMDTLVLASLANVQSGVQSSTPNFLTTRRAFFNAVYLLTPSWRLRGEAGRLKQSNEVPERQ